MKAISRALVAAIAVTALLAACKSSSTTPPLAPSAAATTSKPTNPKSSGSHSQQPVVPNQKPVGAENNPPGDIADSTAYVPLRSKSGGLSFTYPEGWSRHASKSSVNLTDKLNSIDVSWMPAQAAPTVASAKKTEVPQLSQSQLAFRLQSVKTANLPAGTAVLITYEINSPPDKVTGKQYRMVVLRYELFHNGGQANITLTSPVGADNVDPWNTVSQSFKWA